MTGVIKHAENAVLARRELKAVRALSSEIVENLVALAQHMYVHSGGSLKHMTFNRKPIRDIIDELGACESAADMLAALTRKQP